MRGEGIDDASEGDDDDDGEANDGETPSAAAATVPKVEPKATIDPTEEDDEMDRFAKLVAERKRNREGAIKQEAPPSRPEEPQPATTVSQVAKPKPTTTVQVKVKAAKPAKSAGFSLLGGYDSE